MVRKRIGLAALVGAAACGVAACATTPKTEAERQADAATAERVQAALSADRTLFSRHITVRADDGVVTLGGYVWTPEELQLAKQDAQAVEGVTRVVDRIEIDRGGQQDSSVTR